MAKNRFYNLSDKKYQYWNPFRIGETEYTFEHLNAIKVDYHRDNGDWYSFYITYSHHVFSVGNNHPSINNDQRYEYNFVKSDPRIFSIERYRLSLLLPEILKNLPDKICYHGGYGKFCTCEIKDENSNKKYYQIVFNVFKSGSKLRMHIESAYPLDKWPGRIKKVGFWIIAFNLHMGKPLPRRGLAGIPYKTSKI